MDDIIDINTMFGPFPAAASDLPVDELDVMMQKHGVRACCTLSTVGLLLDYNAGNAATRAACSENPSLVPVATLNPQTCFNVDVPIARFAADGFKLVRLFPALQGWEVGYAPFIALTKRLESEGLPLMVDVDRPGVATRLVASITTFPAPLILAGIDERTLAEAIALMRARPNVCLETSSLLATGALKQAVDCVGAERLLFGSGAPARPMASALGLLRHSGLTAEQHALVRGGNARKLLGIQEIG